MNECYDKDCPWHDYQKNGENSEPFCTIDFCAKGMLDKDGKLSDDDAMQLLNLLYDFASELNEILDKQNERLANEVEIPKDGVVYPIRTLQDLTSIPVDRLDDFFIDLKASLVAFHELEKLGVKWDGLIWYDDGKYGEMLGVKLNIEDDSDE